MVCCGRTLRPGVLLHVGLEKFEVVEVDPEGWKGSKTKERIESLNDLRAKEAKLLHLPFSF